MRQVSVVATLASFLLTVVTYEAYVNINVSPLYASIWRFLVSPLAPAGIAEAKPDTFAFTEESGVFISVTIAVLLCFWACWLEILKVKTVGKSAKSAGILCLGIAILFANIQLLSWNI